MKDFQSYIIEDEIIRQICKIRVKIAKGRNKRHLLHLLTSNPNYNYHIENSNYDNDFEQYQERLISQLRSILPPRKHWVKLGKYSRVRRVNENKVMQLTTNDKNYYSLIKTIRKHQKYNSKEKWFLNLKEFISKVQESSKSKSYQITTPLIFPKLKDLKKKPPLLNGETNDCRPICMYELHDRIILSLTNKFLTKLFDQYFYDSSFAFRSRKIGNKTVSHHNCIKEIVAFKRRSLLPHLFVVECDMKKFYDTVNHKIVLEKFNELIEKAKIDNPNLDLGQCEHIFISYLESYSFNNNVIKTATDKYWVSYNITSGHFPWVESELSQLYNNLEEHKIGVPQGGALSGLIANIYLNTVDAEFENFGGLYLRFCDDMIIIHDDLDEIKLAKNAYLKALNELKLVAHPFDRNEELQDFTKDKLSYKPFWKSKSKGPYRWSPEFELESFPWIAFVGYQINFNGELRVRKKSLQKEYLKQKQIITEIKKAIATNPRCKKGTPLESAINRLIGMSVGRIALHNFDEVETNMCWKNGFQELKLNVHSSRQLKMLDRNRSRLYYDLEKYLEELFKGQETNFDSKNREIVDYDKPFSYFYQILERSK